MAVLGGGAVSYERGTPVPRSERHKPHTLALLQGYLPDSGLTHPFLSPTEHFLA